MRRTSALVLALAAVTAGAGIAAAKPPTGSSSVTIQATPNPVVYGSRITITGQATGKNNGGATVTLYAKSAPASAAKPVATTTSSATGQYQFKTAPSTNTVYSVKVHTAPQATSADVAVKVAVKVTLSLTGGAGHMFFGGFVSPSYTGKSVLIQRRTAGAWKNVASAKLMTASSVQTALGTTTRSKYRKRLRLKTGTYRAFFDPADGLRIANASPTRRI